MLSNIQVRNATVRSVTDTRREIAPLYTNKFTLKIKILTSNQPNTWFSLPCFLQYLHGWLVHFTITMFHCKMFFNDSPSYIYTTSITYLLYFLSCDDINTVLSPQCQTYAGLILNLHPANDRRCYKVTLSLIGWAQSWNQQDQDFDVE